jgi:hypothetical protein
MNKLLFVAGVMFAAGCGGKADNALGEMEGFKDKMCACPDQACADAVRKDFKDWNKKMREDNVKKSDLTDDQKKRAKDINVDMDTCAAKLRGERKAKGAKPADEKKPDETK